MRWLDGITGSMHMGLGELRKVVLDKEAWRAAIHGVTKSQTWLSDWTELNWLYHMFLFWIVGISYIFCIHKLCYILVIVVQSLCCVWLFVTLWTEARWPLLSSTVFWSLLKFMSIKLVMLSNHLILWEYFPVCGLPIHLLNDVFDEQWFYILISSNFSIFSFLVIAL